MRSLRLSFFKADQQLDIFESPSVGFVARFFSLPFLDGKCPPGCPGCSCCLSSLFVLAKFAFVPLSPPPFEQASDQHSKRISPSPESSFYNQRRQKLLLSLPPWHRSDCLCHHQSRHHHLHLLHLQSEQTQASSSSVRRTFSKFRVHSGFHLLALLNLHLASFCLHSPSTISTRRHASLPTPPLILSSAASFMVPASPSCRHT